MKMWMCGWYSRIKPTRFIFALDVVERFLQGLATSLPFLKKNPHFEDIGIKVAGKIERIVHR